VVALQGSFACFLILSSPLSASTQKNSREKKEDCFFALVCVLAMARGALRLGS
jgi:hypothetical protein